MVKWSPKPKVSLVLPMAEDLTPLSAAWVSEAEPLGPCGTRFPWEKSYTRALIRTH